MAATIKPIEAKSVHQIQSGQVIVDLCSVIKELVENALDAAATSIEVRFRNNGLDAIEVQDNGSGIAEANYESVGLKHHTSKLYSYAELSKLNTFGFRGEALSSLCALSTLSIVVLSTAVQVCWLWRRLKYVIEAGVCTGLAEPASRKPQIGRCGNIIQVVPHLSFICDFMFAFIETPTWAVQVNATGVMPVIFSSSLLALPAAAARYTGSAFVASAATLLGPSGALYLPVSHMTTTPLRTTLPTRLRLPMKPYPSARKLQPHSSVHLLACCFMVVTWIL